LSIWQSWSTPFSKETVLHRPYMITKCCNLVVDKVGAAYKTPLAVRRDPVVSSHQFYCVTTTGIITRSDAILFPFLNQHHPSSGWRRRFFFVSWSVSVSSQSFFIISLNWNHVTYTRYKKKIKFFMNFFFRSIIIQVKILWWNLFIHDCNPRLCFFCYSISFIRKIIYVSVQYVLIKNYQIRIYKFIYNYIFISFFIFLYFIYYLK